MSIDDDIWVRALLPGTTGWSTADFRDKRFAREWEQGRFEIIEGVLACCPPNYFLGGMAVHALVVMIDAAATANSLRGHFCSGSDLILSPSRVVHANAVFMTASDLKRQEAAEAKRDADDPLRYRVLVPPTLIVESTSAGYERHDTCAKMHFYREFGIPNYWILDQHRRKLACYRLHDAEYVVEATGSRADKLKIDKPFAMTIPLKNVFASRFRKGN